LRVFRRTDPCDADKREDNYGTAVTADGRVWFASLGFGLAVWNPARGADPPIYYGTAAGLPSMNLVDVVNSADGKLWVATQANGVVKFDPATGRVVDVLDTAD